MSRTAPPRFPVLSHVPLSLLERVLQELPEVDLVADNLRRYRAGRPLEGVVDVELGY
jgi:hypothetical protein